MAWRIYTTYETSINPDWSYMIVTIALQCHLELWLGIIAANLPMMGYLFNKQVSPIVSFFSKLRSTGYFSRLTGRSGATQDSSNSKLSRNQRRKFEHISKVSKESITIPLTDVVAQSPSDLESGYKSGPSIGGIRRGVEVRVDSHPTAQHPTENSNLH